MWSIKEVKQKGKAAMKANYWMTFAVSLLMMILVGSGGGSVAGSAHNAFNRELEVNNNLENNQAAQEAAAEAENIASEIMDDINNMSDMEAAALFGVIMALIGAIAIIGFLWMLFGILVTNPLKVGFMNFFVRNCDAPASFGEVKRGFSPSWFGNVLTMLLTSIYVFLWSLLFFIPGLVKSYSYALVPYIRADRPELSANQTITLSRKLMNGNKLRLFLFDLSFIGWSILGLLTCGILTAFYVMPYYNCSKAEVYRSILAENPGL